MTPHSEEAERAVLGALLIDASLMLDVGGMDDSVFFSSQHRTIFAAMRKAYADTGALDVYVVQGRLPKEVRPYLADLFRDTAVSTNVQTYTIELERLARERRVLSACSDMLASYDNASPSVSHEEELSALSAALTDTGDSQKTWAPFRDIIGTRANELIDGTGPSKFAKTGIPGLDRILTGYMESDLVILAGRPSAGKSAFALQGAIEIARSGGPVVFGSSEMASIAVANRALSYESLIKHRRIRDGRTGPADVRDINTAAATLYDLPILVDDRGGLKPSDLWGLVRRCRQMFGSCAAVFCDYIQIMDPTTDNKMMNQERRIASISKELKQLAKGASLPVIALSQFSRAGAARTTARPKLSDLRDSGALEQDADVVIFLWYESEEERRDPLAKVKCTVAKQRNGETGELDLIFDKPTQQFHEGDR